MKYAHRDCTLNPPCTSDTLRLISPHSLSLPIGSSLCGRSAQVSHLAPQAPKSTDIPLTARLCPSVLAQHTAPSVRACPAARLRRCSPIYPLPPLAISPHPFDHRATHTPIGSASAESARCLTWTLLNICSAPGPSLCQTRKTKPCFAQRELGAQPRHRQPALITYDNETSLCVHTRRSVLNLFA
jgi:hypothetical protein